MSVDVGTDTGGDDAWDRLRRLSGARVGLGRTGASLPTAAWMEFSLAHALAREAVHAPFAVDSLRTDLERLGMRPFVVASEAASREIYLQRPDLGRRVRSGDRDALETRAGAYDLAIVVGDGLSPAAVARSAPEVLRALCEHLNGWQIAPVVIAIQARVAIGDDIGEALGARCTVVLIGERPGLSSSESMGIYMTWNPRRGCHDAQRNCISNVREDGLAPHAAAARLAWLIAAARRLGASGVILKDDSPSEIAPLASRDPGAIGPI